MIKLKMEECGIKWGRMAGNSEEGQGPQRAVASMMMMMMMMIMIKLSLRLTKRRHMKTYRTKKLNSVVFSPQANYTDRVTAACRRS
jgi:hypothetical protein